MCMTQVKALKINKDINTYVYVLGSSVWKRINEANCDNPYPFCI